MIRYFSTFFGIGWMPFAPGTWGSLAAIPFAYALHLYGGFALLAWATIIVTLIGWALIELDQRRYKQHDPKQVVIDEVAGQWIALLPLSYMLDDGKTAFQILPYPGVLAAFILFRVFDIWKPWIIGWADRKQTSFGVMLDDVFAGIFAGVGTLVIGYTYHALFI